MRRQFALVLAIGLSFLPTVNGQSRSKPARLPAGAWSESGILSDTQGFDLKPYLSEVERATRSLWIRDMPDEAKTPMSRAGSALIRFQILPNGQVKNGSMILEERAGTTTLDRSAWSAIVQSHYPPVPAGYNGTPIDLRIRFRFNGGAAMAPPSYRSLPAAITFIYPNETAQ